MLASGIIESIVSVAKAKEEAKLAKTLGQGRKKQKLIGIPKLEDANLAGTKNGE
jgi:DNA topoisomerase-2